MRLVFLAALVGLLLASHPANGGEFPFTGYIGVARAEVASGAGRRFYVTGHLPRGETVEVYREDDAGWLAIRPPDGSFSWIPAEHIERLDDGVGRVKSPTESWIGTSVEEVKEHKSQVALKAGELVQVLDEKTVASNAGEEKWLKIAPPAGEFRYVHSRDVSREKVEADPLPMETAIPDDVLPVEEGEELIENEQPAAPRRFRPSDGAIALRDIDEVRSRLASMREDLASLAGSRTSGDGVQQAQFRSSADPTGSHSLSPDGFVPRKRRASEQLGPVPVPSNQFTRGSSPAQSRPRPDPRLGPLPQIADARAGEARSYAVASRPADSAAEQLDQWEVELSLMIAQDRSTWNLAGLRQKVEGLVESGSDPIERGRARLLLEKIEQFEEAFAAGGRGPLGSSPDGGTQPAAGSLADPRYDAQGWLKPVISKNKPVAPYAIVDADGKPLCFVSPSPGMNVGRYVNKQVGLYGRRGYIESLQTPHVTAERVIDLERVVR